MSILVVVLLAVGCNTRQPSEKEIREIKLRIESDKPPRFVSKTDHGRTSWKSTMDVYAARQFRPAWSARGHVHSAADDFLRVLENAPAEGLHVGDFALPE